MPYQVLTNMFDYLYYRIFRNFKLRGNAAPETAGSMVLSFIQFMTILNVIVVCHFAFGLQYPSKLIFVLIFLAIAILNYIRYERHFNEAELGTRWQTETDDLRIRRGWIIGIYVTLTTLTPIVIGFLDVNLDVI